MKYGELSKHSKQYQSGHKAGSEEGFDYAIEFFDMYSSIDNANSTLSCDQIIKFLKDCKNRWLLHCNSFGMGLDREDLE